MQRKATFSDCSNGAILPKYILNSIFYIYVMATSFFYIYVMATSFFYIYIDIYIDIYFDI